MKPHLNIGILGCGHMGTVIAQTLVKKKLGRVIVGNLTKPRINVEWTADNRKVVKLVDIIIIAVRPNDVPNVLSEIKPLLQKNQLLISIAAGTPIAKLKKYSNHAKIVRVMPNLPVCVLEGMSVWKAANSISRKEKRIVKNILAAFGKEIEVRDEKLIDMTTAISGGAPAYIAAFLEVMAATAQKSGFSKENARLLALQAVKGSILYIEKTNEDFAVLKKAVQTKRGTTEAAFKVLNSKKWHAILGRALQAAYNKAVTMSLRASAKQSS